MTDSYYNPAKRVFEKNQENIMSNTLMLADVFEKFRNMYL